MANSQGITAEDLQRYNDRIRVWGNKVRQAAAGNLGKIPSRSKVKVRYSQRDLEIYKIGFPFPRHLVFVAKGVGRGWPIGRANEPGNKRKPFPWLNPVVDQYQNELMQIVIDEKGKQVTGELKKEIAKIKIR